MHISSQKNRHHMKMMKTIPIPPTGTHFRNSISRLMFLAAFLYFADSDRNEVDRCDIPAVSSFEPLHSRSKLSPRQSRSSMFFVMILVTSFRFSFN